MAEPWTGAGRVTCPFCGAPICFPRYGQPAVCLPCDRRFELVEDYGFFTYTCEVYEPALKDDE